MICHKTEKMMKNRFFHFAWKSEVQHMNCVQIRPFLEDSKEAVIFDENV